MRIALGAQLLPVCLLLGFFTAATSWFCHNDKEAVLFFVGLDEVIQLKLKVI